MPNPEPPSPPCTDSYDLLWILNPGQVTRRVPRAVLGELHIKVLKRSTGLGSVMEMDGKGRSDYGLLF